MNPKILKFLVKVKKFLDFLSKIHYNNKHKEIVKENRYDFRNLRATQKYFFY